MSECVCPDGLNGQPHICEAQLQPNGRPTLSINNEKPKTVDKGGRPKGFNGTTAKANSHIAQAFKRMGLDWREDLAKAIMKNDRYRIKLWLKLLPHLIVSSRKSKMKRWKGKPSKAAMIALEKLEGRDD